MKILPSKISNFRVFAFRDTSFINLFFNGHNLKFIALLLALAVSTFLSVPFSSLMPASAQNSDLTEPLKDSAQEAERNAFKASYQKGAKLFQEKKYQAAAASLAVAAQSPLDDGEAGILLGYCFYEMHQYQKALEQYKKVSQSGKLISVKNRAQRLAATLNSYMKGICPGNCLKPTTPGWRKMDVPGKPDRLVWMVFPYLDPAGKGGSEYWSNDHMGEVIEYVNGRPINKGPCPLCSGTGKVSLPK